jgi:hypothetical protein
MSSNGTGSAYFRVLTNAVNLGDEVRLRLTLLKFTALVGSADAWDGPSVLLRYQGDNDYYVINVSRRDNRAAIQKKRAGVSRTLATVSRKTALNAPQSVRALAAGNGDGSVRISLYIDGLPVVSAIDSSDTIPAGGRVGVASEDAEFKFDDFTVPGGAPLPILTSVSPSSSVAGGAGFALTLSGANFGVDSVALWNGSARPTTFVSSLTLTAAIAASDIVSSGTAAVSVRNPSGDSNAVGFDIVPAAAGNVAFYDGFDYPDGLITNSNESSARSDKWFLRFGSLFASNGQGWTGVPDSVWPDATSSNGTGSAYFRALTNVSNPGDEVRFNLTMLNFTSLIDGADAWDGPGAVLRYQSDNDYYQISINRRDDRAVIQKKRAGVTKTLGKTARATPFNFPQAVRAAAATNSDGSVTVALYVDGVEVLSARDPSNVIPAGGRVGLTSEDANFKFDDFVVPASGVSGLSALAALETPALMPLAGSADASFRFNDAYAFPNPSCRGQNVTVRLQCGVADSVDLCVYDASGHRVHNACFPPPKIMDDGNGKGPQYTYDYCWDVGGMGSGVYLYLIRAKKLGERDITKTVKGAIVK